MNALFSVCSTRAEPERTCSWEVPAVILPIVPADGWKVGKWAAGRSKFRSFTHSAAVAETVLRERKSDRFLPHVGDGAALAAAGQSDYILKRKADRQTLKK